jgi:glycerol-3-phosphate cytidylyltransferase
MAPNMVPSPPRLGRLRPSARRETGAVLHLTDEMVVVKGRSPVFSQEERLEIVANVKAVDEVFIEESLEQKREYVLGYQADILVMGDDWQGKFDHLNDICRVVYLPRTPSVSTTAIIEQIVGNS